MAMRKYGIENFRIECVEECSADNLSEREVFWIRHHDTYTNGYNATKGGDGTQYCDYDAVYNMYILGMTVKTISQLLGYTEDTCRKVLYLNNISAEEIKRKATLYRSKQIAKIDKRTNDVIKIYPSIADAYSDLGKIHSGHIADVCSGRRKTAYGYRWAYIFT